MRYTRPTKQNTRRVCSDVISVKEKRSRLGPFRTFGFFYYHSYRDLSFLGKR